MPRREQQYNALGALQAVSVCLVAVMKTAHSDLPRAVCSSHSPAGQASPPACTDHITAFSYSLLHCTSCWSGCLLVCSSLLLELEASRGAMLQLGLSASSLDSLYRAGQKASCSTRPSPAVPSPPALLATSWICIPAHKLCTAHEAELGPLPHTLQCSGSESTGATVCQVPASPGHKAVAEVLLSSLKLCGVLSTQKLPGALSSSICQGTGWQQCTRYSYEHLRAS